MRRRLREAIRVGLLPEAPPLDIVIRLSKAGYGLPFAVIRDEIGQLRAKLESF